MLKVESHKVDMNAASPSPDCSGNPFYSGAARDKKIAV